MMSSPVRTLHSKQAASAAVGMERFILQYISLILIVVCMIVAIDSLPEQPAVVGAPALPAPPKADVKLTTEDFSDLFAEKNFALNEDRYQVLSAFLMSHEISLEMKLFTSEQEFKLALARASALRKRLVADGVPSAALTIQIIENEKDEGHFPATFKRKHE